jgi:hypothetical protein
MRHENPGKQQNGRDDLPLGLIGAGGRRLRTAATASLDQVGAHL